MSTMNLCQLYYFMTTMTLCQLHDVLEFWVGAVDAERLLHVVGVAQHELEELGDPEGREDGVAGGDGAAQHGEDSLALRVHAVQLDRLQRPRTLALLLAVTLQ